LQLQSHLKSIDTKWCDTCIIDEDPFEKITGSAESTKDRERWQQNTETKAYELLKMLEDLNPKGMTPQEKKTHDHIEESKRLLRLYKMIKDKALEAMTRAGIEVQLPSAAGTYVDASGKQWENAEPKDSLDRLKLEWDKSVKKNQDALQREIDRKDVEQFKDPNQMAVSKFVAKLPKPRGESNDCACSCGVMVCPCTCANEATVVTGDIPRVEDADTDDDDCSKGSSPTSC
jgi:hypothetical protein